MRGAGEAEVRPPSNPLGGGVSSTGDVKEGNFNKTQIHGIYKDAAHTDNCNDGVVATGTLHTFEGDGLDECGGAATRCRGVQGSSNVKRKRPTSLSFRHLFLVLSMSCLPLLAQCATKCRRGGAVACPEDDHGEASDASDDHGDDHEGAHFTLEQESNIIIATLSSIFVVSVVFEKFKEFLLESAGKQIKPIVQAMFSELSALGFIAICLFIVIEAKVFDEHVKHLVERVHMLLFAILMLYLLTCFALTRIGTSLGKKWKKYESLADGGEMAAIRGLTMATILHREKSVWSRFCGQVAAFILGPFRSYDPIKGMRIKNIEGPAGAAIQEVVEFKSLAQAESTISYLSLRQRFVQMPHKGTSLNNAQIKGFEKNFALNEYLAIAMVEVLIEIVEIPAWAWFGMEMFFICFYGWLQLAGLAGLAVWVGFGYLLLFSIWCLKTSLTRIEQSLTPQGWIKFAADQYAIRKRSMLLTANRAVSPNKGRKVQVAGAASPTTTGEAGGADAAGGGGGGGGAENTGKGRPSTFASIAITAAEGSDDVHTTKPNIRTRTNTQGELEPVLMLAPDASPTPPTELPLLHEQTEHAGGQGADANDAVGAPSSPTGGTKPTRRSSTNVKEDITLQLEEPPFSIHTPVNAGERRNCFARVIMGAPPSPQESLFWLDRHGPHMCLYMIRLLLVLNSVYITLLVAYGTSQRYLENWDCYNKEYTVLPDADHHNVTTSHARREAAAADELPYTETLKPVCGFLLTAGAFPPLIMILMLGTTIQKLVIVTHVEEMRSSEKIAKTVRTMKARKALIALKLLSKLKKTTTKTLKGKQKGVASEKDIPHPVKTDHVELPSAIHDLSEHLAELAHHDWAETRQSAGWTHGAVRDNSKKIHPELVAWSELPEGSKAWNRDECMSQLKVIVALGFDIVKDPKFIKAHFVKVASFVGKGKRKSQVGPEEMLGDHMSDPRLEHHKEKHELDIEPHIAQLGEMLAANTHQAWAQSKIKAGWMYGDHVDDEAKTHDLLVPFGDLDSGDQSVNRNQARSSLLAIMNYGFRCVIKKRVLRSVGDRDSVIDAAKLSKGHGPEDSYMDRDDIYKAFAMFDTNGDGFIPSTYILPALKTLGWALTETDAVQIILDMDEMMTGYVEYSAFAGWIVGQENENNDNTDPEELVRAAFAHIDKDNSGNITATELLEALNELGEDLEYEDVQKIVSEADSNDDGHIDIHEFSNLLKDVMEQNF